MRYFLEALDQGSFSRAATHLRLSQQAVSKSIERLENEMGVRLFERNGRQLQPTSEGLMVEEHARAMLAEERQIHRKLDELTGRSSGRLDIGTSPVAADIIVEGAVQRVLNEYPGLQVSVTAGTTSSLSPQLKNGKLDAYVSLLVQRKPDPLLNCEILFSEPMILVAQWNHPLSIKPAVTLRDTLKYPWLIGTGMEHWGDLVRKSFVDAGLKPPKPGVQTSSVFFAKTFLSNSNYVCILPAHMVRPDIDSKRLIRIPIHDVQWDRPMALFYRRNTTFSPAITQFVKATRDIARAIRQTD